MCLINLALNCAFFHQSSHKNLKHYEDVAEVSKEFFSCDNQDDDTQSDDITSLSELEKKILISSFHQADVTEIQVINKNIKGLKGRTIYRIFKEINENKGIQRRPGSERKVL